jgi:CBS domain-containing protein
MRRTVSEFMTASPLTIEWDRRLSEAIQVMREHGIRHLPVTRRGELCGIVSERDLHFIRTIAKVDCDVACVDDALTPDPFVVRPDAPIDEVAEAMAAHKFGAAIVWEEGRGVVGLFTTIDALWALAELARPRRRGRPRKVA